MSYGTIRYFPKLYGVTVIGWEKWTSEEVDRELADIKNRGFNFVSFQVHFHIFFDWETPEFDISRDPDFYDKLVYFMNGVAKNGLFAEPIPMEPWKYGDSRSPPPMKFWWTNPTLQERISFYYRTYAKWCKDMGWNNIVWITLWVEPAYYSEWVDGAYVVEKQMPNYNETNEDWKQWLSQNGITPVDLTIDNINRYIDQYITWSRNIFNLVTQIKANAVKEGWPGSLVAGEIGYALERCGTGPAYHPSRYLQLCAEPYVDVLSVHDYFDSTWWALEPYLEAIKGKPVVVNEMGPPSYRGVWASKTEDWWYYMKPKMELATTMGKGFAIWSWKDYNTEEPWGLKDIDFNPRPILQLVSNWLSTQSH